MKTATTTAVQLEEAGRRLDASYHASDGVRAHHFIRQWAGQTARPQAALRGTTRERVSTYSKRRLDSLAEVCVPDGIFIPGRFRRIYVEDSKHGESWLSPSDMLRADLSGLPLVSRKFTPAIETLRLHQGWILLSRSGTIGNMAYVRSDMDNLIGSDDIIRIVADGGKVPSGYLYAWLSSPPGRALIEQQTYGAVIPHIEAHHVVDLPVPRLDSAIEQRINELVERASQLRVEANQALGQAVKAVEDEVGFSRPQAKFDHAYEVGLTPIARDFSHRLDSFAYVGYTAEALKCLSRYDGRVERAPDVGYRMFNPPIFKRMFAAEGYPYMSGVDFYAVRPTTNRYLSKSQHDVEQYIVSKNMVLVQNAGQRYGLITTPILITRVLDGVAITSDVIRIMHDNLIENGYICALLASDFGRRLALRYSYGTSIPRLNVPEFQKFKMPWPRESTRRAIGSATIAAYEMRDQANLLEDQAQALLADALTTETAP